MPLTKRAMILFDPEQYHRLEEEARRQRKSIGALVRDAIEKGILEKAESSLAAKREAASRLISREEEVPDWETIEQVIARGHSDVG